MNYKEFEKAVEILDLCSKSTLQDAKQKYKNLSKRFHPDMPEGSQERFQEIKEAYLIVKTYMEQFRYSLDEEEFKKQFPLFVDMKNWRV